MAPFTLHNLSLATSMKFDLIWVKVELCFISFISCRTLRCPTNPPHFILYRHREKQLCFI